jgi:hypothetical protein
MNIYPLPDITGDAATHAISDSLPADAKWIQLLADAGNSGVVRIGGADTTDTFGFPLAAGKSMFIPQDHADIVSYYPLANVFYNAGNGDVLYVLYGAG